MAFMPRHPTASSAGEEKEEEGEEGGVAPC
jgi:hypothetical protein